MTTALPAAADFTAASTQGAAKTAYANQRQFLADLLGTSGLAADARTALGLGSIATQAASSVAITGGAIDGTPIGGTTKAAVSCTTLTATGAITGTGTATSSLISSVDGDFQLKVRNSHTTNGYGLQVRGGNSGSNTSLSVQDYNGTNTFVSVSGNGYSSFIGTMGAGSSVMNVGDTTRSTVGLLIVDATGWSAASAGMYLGKQSGTGRSLNAGGTVNASGADLAEYRLTGEIRLPVAKGQVIGYQADGKVTDKWSLSVGQSRWQIKTTNPHVVGGDSWGTEEIIGKRPVEPVLQLSYEGPEEPVPPMELPPAVLPEQPPVPVRQSDEDDATYKVRMATWRDESARVDARIVDARAAYAYLQALHEQLVVSYQDARRIWEEAQQAFAAQLAAAKHTLDTVTLPAYQNDLAAWEARLEAQRQTVDRIAYNGEVPMLTGQAKPKKAGDRVVPIEGPDDTIDVKFVDPGEIEFRDYVRCCGTVTSVREDGTCIVAVKVG